MTDENIELLKNGLAALNIDASKADILAKYADILIETNEKFNLLGKVDEKDIVIKHILDSAAGVKFIKDARTVLDIGTGAGFPGFVLAVCCPDKKFTLADATEKKIAFIKDTAVLLGVNNITAISGRAEELAHGKMRESFDTCVSRAVAALNKLAEYCIPFVKVGGILVAYKGPLVFDEINEAEFGIKALGGEVEAVRKENVPYLEGERCFAVIRKKKPTNPIYPRKNAQIINKPLRA